MKGSSASSPQPVAIAKIGEKKKTINTNAREVYGTRCISTSRRARWSEFARARELLFAISLTHTCVGRRAVTFHAIFLDKTVGEFYVRIVKV